MKKIAVVTATRAEYGILRPLIFRLKKEKNLKREKRELRRLMHRKSLFYLHCILMSSGTEPTLS